MRTHALVLTIPVGVEMIELVEEKRTAGECEGLAFVLRDRLHVVAQIIDGWLESEHVYVEVKVRDGRKFMLRQDGATGQWTASALIRPGNW